MHDINPVLPTDVLPAPDVPWYKLLNRYHWFVLTVCALGWLLDCMDQQLFNLARRPAMLALVGEDNLAADSTAVTAIFLIGWGVGGIGFGIVADLFGRAKSMVYTILLYSLFTGLSAFAVGFWDFALYRFLTGLGVGGQFAVGVSLVAEEIPDRARSFALGWLQALSAIGNVSAALVGIVLAFLVRGGTIQESWRIMFVVGMLPALLVLVIMRRLREPERWVKMTAGKNLRERLGNYGGELFDNPRWRRNALIGLILASSGIIGLWAIGFFSYDLAGEVLSKHFKETGVSAKEAKFWETLGASFVSLAFNIGAFFGIHAFSRVTYRYGRRLTFALSFVFAMLSTALVFWKFDSISDIFWMIPLMGFCQLAIFGGYAIYFPELFPTRLRGTGISLCYNGARFVAAAGTFLMGPLRDYFTKLCDGDKILAFRYAGIVMCATFLIGLAALPFAPETKGQPLPE